MDKNQCINCKNLEKCCNENEVDSIDIFESQDICNDFEDGRLTIEELRDQFESETEIPSQIDWDGEDYMYYGDDRDLNLMLDETRVRWYGWKYCAKVNNLLKE